MSRKTMPKQKPGRSRQDYGTPPEFLKAVKNLLRIEAFDVDLAADPKNAVARRYFTEEDNCFTKDWNQGDGWNWLNPPFGNIEPFVSKALDESLGRGAKTAVLVPASVGARWWYNHVDHSAMVYFLRGRLTFVGEHTPYPKDCALLLYAPYILRGGYEVWNWRDQT